VSDGALLVPWVLGVLPRSDARRVEGSLSGCHRPYDCYFDDSAPRSGTFRLFDRATWIWATDPTRVRLCFRYRFVFPLPGSSLTEPWPCRPGSLQNLSILRNTSDRILQGYCSRHLQRLATQASEKCRLALSQTQSVKIGTVSYRG
jgi:hypothetical protein